MTPGTLNLPIFQGSKWEHLLSLTDPSGAVVDLTGLSPFTCTLSRPTRRASIGTVTVTDTDLAAGQITLTITPAVTATLPLGTVMLSLSDALGNPYIASLVPVLYFTPDA